MTGAVSAGPAPAVDPDIAAPLIALRELTGGTIPSLSAQVLPYVRAGFPSVAEPVEHFGRDGRFVVSEVAATRPGGPDVPLLVCVPASRPVCGTVVYAHGGGMILGDQTGGLDELLDTVDGLGLAVVSVGYRLAPETVHPGPVEDCWWGLSWTVDHARQLGLASGPFIVAGASAGGGLAAATALLARDRGRPVIAGQLLMAPMLDHRSDSTSMRRIGDAGMWTRESNVFGWDCLLGPDHEGAVSAYASPAVADDLAGLPPLFVEVGGADAFLDESVDYALRVSHAGGLVDLHVWAGGYHGFVGMRPEAPVSRAAQAARAGWLDRIIGSNTPASTHPTKENA